MDSSEAGLDRIEAQRSTVMSHDQQKQSYFPMNLIRRSLCGEDESVPEYLANLRIPDLFQPPGEPFQISPEMFTAVSEGDRECMEMLRGYDKSLACLKSEHGDTVLHLAAACGHRELVKSMISECPRLFLELDSRGQLPLHVAAHIGHGVITQTLVETEQFISARLSNEEEREKVNLYVVKDNREGDTPLHLAIKGRHMKTAARLVQANQQASFVEDKYGISPLYLAVEAGDLSLVEAMLETRGEDGIEGRYLDLATRLKGRKYLVHAALKARSTGLLDLILREYPSLIGEIDEEGRTCLWLAASMGYYEGVRILLDHSEEFVYVSVKDGSYPIHVAVEKRHMRVVFLLLTRCPDSKHLLNKKGQNILHTATKGGIGSIVLFIYLWLIGRINQLVGKQDVDGNTPLHLATINWRPRTLFVLLTTCRTKWLYVCNKSGLTALDIADSKHSPNYIFMERVTLMVLKYFYAPLSRESWFKRITKPSEPLKGDKNKDYVNTLLVVAALVTTVTFAAGITIPGGFDSDVKRLGFPARRNDTKLAYFMVADTLAMQSSLVTIAVLIWAQLGDPALLHTSLYIALPSLFVSLLCMLVAFYFGVFVVFKDVKGIVIFLNGTSAIFLFLMLFLLAPHVFLQIPGIPAFFASYFLLFVMLVDEDSLTSVKISPNEENEEKEEKEERRRRRRKRLPLWIYQLKSKKLNKRKVFLSF